MPSIKPFKALIPSSDLLTDVVTRPLEYYGVNEANLIASKKVNSFFNLINPKSANLFMRGSAQEIIYKNISENLESFLDNKTLIQADKPAIYIYRVKNNGLTQVGIWTLTNINDYLAGNIKKHEHTVESRERLLTEYLEQTGLDANPVLITYPPNVVIDELIDHYINQKPDIEFDYKDSTRHSIWLITNINELKMIVDTFALMSSVYIADGHHRIASIAKMKANKFSLSKNEHAGHNFFSTIYMNTQQIRVLEYNRLVKDLSGLNEEDFLTAISASFYIEKQKQAIKATTLHEFGMCLKSGWYKLIAKPGTYNSDPVDVLDVSILQKYLLEPILNIKNPRTDSRIEFEGGNTPLTELEKKINNEDYAVAFALFPISVEQIINIADANRIMPPKSTWVEPKFLVGLLTHLFNE